MDIEIYRDPLRKNNPFVLRDKITQKIVKDSNGYGFKTFESAKRAKWAYLSELKKAEAENNEKVAEFKRYLTDLEIKIEKITTQRYILIGSTKTTPVNPLTEDEMKELSNYVCRLGTTTQKERWEAGVMPAWEAAALFSKEVFSGLDRHDEEFDFYPLVDFEGCPVKKIAKTDLNDSQWLIAKQIRSLAPLGKLKAYNVKCPNVCDLSCCPVDFLQVSASVGRFVFIRNVNCSDHEGRGFLSQE